MLWCNNAQRTTKANRFIADPQETFKRSAICKRDIRKIKNDALGTVRKSFAHTPTHGV